MCCKIYDPADSKITLQKYCEKNICQDCQREAISNDLLLGRSARLGREDIRYNIRKRIAWKRESLMFGKLSQWREERKIQKGICRKALSSSPNSVLFDRIQVGRRWDVWDRQHVGSCSENNTRRCEEKCQEIICENFHNMTIAIVAVDFALLYCAKRLS